MGLASPPFDSLLTSCHVKVDGWSVLFLSVHVLAVHVRNVYSVYVMSMAQLLDWLVVTVKWPKNITLLCYFYICHIQCPMSQAVPANQ